MSNDFDVVCAQPMHGLDVEEELERILDEEILREALEPWRFELWQVVMSLPLGERQRALALETVRYATREDAEMIIDHHRKLVDGLPAALEAVRRIRSIRPR